MFEIERTYNHPAVVLEYWLGVVKLPKIPVFPEVRERERFRTGQSRAPVQEASRLSQWAVGQWTVAPSICQITPPTTWTSACPFADEKATPARSRKVSVVKLLLMPAECLPLKLKYFLHSSLLQKSLWSTLWHIRILPRIQESLRIQVLSSA